MSNPNGGDLGPRCPVCNVPWTAHGSNEGCSRYRPPSAFTTVAGLKADLDAKDAARERYRAKMAEVTKGES